MPGQVCAGAVGEQFAASCVPQFFPEFVEAFVKVCAYAKFAADLRTPGCQRLFEPKGRNQRETERARQSLLAHHAADETGVIGDPKCCPVPNASGHAGETKSFMDRGRSCVAG